MTTELLPAQGREQLLLDTPFRAPDLARIRVRVDELASAAGLCQARRTEFVLAMHEVAGNAVRHGGGEGTLRLYLSADSLRCQVTDEGPGFDEDVIPRDPPAPGASEDGRGLWIVRQLTDRIDIARGAVGADVTFTMRLAATAAHEADTSAW
ncbi:ATP-binding protein [Streptomyces sp. NPDC086787]|uniref:ATP-binding protein n=1 Tax=Streptomyces sp. NPDC086787 TaxID=3365759 RepID=UPI00382C40BF